MCRSHFYFVYELISTSSLTQPRMRAKIKYFDNDSFITLCTAIIIKSTKKKCFKTHKIL